MQLACGTFSVSILIFNTITSILSRTAQIKQRKKKFVYFLNKIIKIKEPLAQGT